jgi:phytanoyl-CoA hydroxylase
MPTAAGRSRRRRMARSFNGVHHRHADPGTARPLPTRRLHRHPRFQIAEEEIARLRARAERNRRRLRPGESRAVFTTRDQENASDAWFLGSDNTVRCFFEEEAFDADGQLKQAKALSINKIGHAMHDLDPVFEAFTRDAKLAAVARDLGLAQPQVWQSMYIFKQPGIGGEVRWHQDATFFDSDPDQRDHLLVRAGRRDHRQRLPVDRTGRPPRPAARTLPARRRPDHDGKAGRTPWPDDSTAVPLEARAGSLVCFHGLLPHYSAPNRSRCRGMRSRCM